jgi:transcriptional regulator GlxA family with amidase domain
MTALRTILSAFADAMAPDGMILRMRFRTTLDMLVTTAITVLAVVLAVGYQVIGRWARRAGWVD